MKTFSTTKYQAHHAADIFPSMLDAEFLSLKNDIAANGLIEPIWLFEGQILDGRHRYRACVDLGIEPTFRIYADDNPLAFVVSLNLARRHLNESQRSAVAAELANMVQGQRTDLEPSANLPKVSQTEAAEMLNVSTRAVTTAAKVRDESPEIFAAMKSGVMSAHLASQVIELSEDERVVVESSAPEKMKEVARNVVRAHVANNSGNNEWYTPANYIDAARSAMGSIDIDPASSDVANKTVQAKMFFDSQTDGLKQKWLGNVWLNPPYSQPLISDFCAALVSKYSSGETDQACVLVNNATETGWFQALLSEASAVCFVKTRIKFIDPAGNPSGAPLQGQAILYFGKSTNSFSDTFCKFGKVLFS